MASPLRQCRYCAHGEVENLMTSLACERCGRSLISFRFIHALLAVLVLLACSLAADYLDTALPLTLLIQLSLSTLLFLQCYLHHEGLILSLIPLLCAFWLLDWGAFGPESEIGTWSALLLGSLTLLILVIGGFSVWVEQKRRQELGVWEALPALTVALLLQAALLWGLLTAFPFWREYHVITTALDLSRTLIAYRLVSLIAVGALLLLVSLPLSVQYPFPPLDWPLPFHPRRRAPAAILLAPWLRFLEVPLSTCIVLGLAVLKGLELAGRWIINWLYYIAAWLLRRAWAWTKTLLRVIRNTLRLLRGWIASYLRWVIWPLVRAVGAAYFSLELGEQGFRALRGLPLNWLVVVGALLLLALCQFATVFSFLEIPVGRFLKGSASTYVSTTFVIGAVIWLGWSLLWVAGLAIGRAYLPGGGKFALGGLILLLLMMIASGLFSRTGSEPRAADSER